MSEYLFKAEQRIAQLERELAEWEERNKTGWIQELRDHAKMGLSAMRERDALAAIVKQMREALIEAHSLLLVKRGCLERDAAIQLGESIAIDVSKAEAIMRQRDAGVLRKAAERLESADFIKNRPNINYAETNELRRMADELLKS